MEEEEQSWTEGTEDDFQGVCRASACPHPGEAEHTDPQLPKEVADTGLERALKSP